MDQALGQGFRAMAAALEQRRFAATDRPRKQRRPARGRHIPAEVRRTVWQRDQGRCTFLAESGRRCEARGCLEFDHIEPVARGGRARVENLRLRCRAHNQFAAERAFGAGFMHEQWQRARRAAAERRTQAAAAGPRTVAAKAAKYDADRDVIPWLRHLGFRAEEARRAAVHCEAIAHATLEERVRAALSFLSPGVRVGGVHPRAATA
jgi:5-methylcytosine-specific restriction endonuclease McrA